MKKLVWEPKLNLPTGICAPDNFKGEYGSRPPDDFVVSYQMDGSVASRYRDLSWDVRAYDSTGKFGWLYFGSWCEDAPTEKHLLLIREMQWLMFLLIYIQGGKCLACSTLHKYLVLFYALARFADGESLRILDVLSDPIICLRFMDRSTGSVVMQMSRLFSYLMRLGRGQVGFPVLGGVILKELRKRSNKYEDELEQHPPVPTRIYSLIIAALMRELKDFEKVANSYLDLLVECGANPLLGRSYSKQREKMKHQGEPYSNKDTLPGFPELLTERGLEAYFFKKSLCVNTIGATKGLTNIQMICKLIIHIYSGMRNWEVNTLPYHCDKKVKENDKWHYRISGSTTKLNNGRIKRTRWVTSREGVQAIVIAQKVADTIYKILGDQPEQSDSRLNDYPLFISTGYLPFSSSTPKSSGRVRYKPGNLLLAKHTNLLTRVVPEIEEGDLRELERIDPHRAWRQGKVFQVGQQWRFTTHQCRRSLALYASRSGLVSLTSLKRQLQHITQEMSVYYVRGSMAAKNLIGNDMGHFGMEYQKTQSESQALAYIANVLLSEDRLFGAHGTWIERRRVEGHVLTLEDRDETMKRFKRGEMVWEETHLGGCTKIGPCDKKEMRSIIGCIECECAVLKLPKLDRLIRVQESFMKGLNPDSKMWHTEKADLDILQAARKKFTKRLETEIA